MSIVAAKVLACRKTLRLTHRKKNRFLIKVASLVTDGDVAKARAFYAENEDLFGTHVPFSSVFYRKDAACLTWNFADSESFPSYLLNCNICFGALCDPVSSTCGHLFCSSCLNQWIQAQLLQQATCPVCRQALDVPRANLLATQMMEGCEFVCPSEQCDAIGTRKHLLQHLKSCPKAIGVCSSCASVMSSDSFTNHKEHCHLPCTDLTVVIHTYSENSEFQQFLVVRLLLRICRTSTGFDLKRQLQESYGVASEDWYLAYTNGNEITTLCPTDAVLQQRNVKSETLHAFQIIRHPPHQIAEEPAMILCIDNHVPKAGNAGYKTACFPIVLKEPMNVQWDVLFLKVTFWPFGSASFCLTGFSEQILDLTKAMDTELAKQLRQPKYSSDPLAYCQVHVLHESCNLHVVNNQSQLKPFVGFPPNSEFDIHIYWFD